MQATSPAAGPPHGPRWGLVGPLPERHGPPSRDSPPLRYGRSDDSGKGPASAGARHTAPGRAGTNRRLRLGAPDEAVEFGLFGLAHHIPHRLPAIAARPRGLLVGLGRPRGSRLLNTIPQRRPAQPALFDECQPVLASEGDSAVDYVSQIARRFRRLLPPSQRPQRHATAFSQLLLRERNCPSTLSEFCWALRHGDAAGRR